MIKSFVNDNMMYMLKFRVKKCIPAWKRKIPTPRLRVETNVPGMYLIDFGSKKTTVLSQLQVGAIWSLNVGHVVLCPLGTRRCRVVSLVLGAVVYGPSLVSSPRGVIQ